MSSYVLLNALSLMTQAACVSVGRGFSVFIYYPKSYNLCKLPSIKATNLRIDSISFGGSFLLNTLYDSIEQKPTLACFERRISDCTGDISVFSLSKFHCPLHELYLTNHHSSQEHAIYGTSCLLLLFLILLQVAIIQI